MIEKARGGVDREEGSDDEGDKNDGDGKGVR